MNAAIVCTSTPVSWLRLERYHAGDLDDAERERIAAHLASCDACAGCLRRIEDDARELPPLPAPKAQAKPPSAGGGVVVALRRAAPFALALAVAAGVLLVVGRGPRVEPVSDRIKGSDVSFALVRDDDMVLGEAGVTYRDGDRFKAAVTCPPGMHGGFDVVVYENGEAAFPLEPQSDLACGNGVALPGAFRVTGRERMVVCLVWSDGGTVDREAMRRTPPEMLERARCKTLDPAP